MKKIRIITGGIGSGKSYVCDRLRQRGIAVYDCDAAAKRIMRDDAAVRQRLTMLIGDGTYDGTVLNKAKVSQFLLASDSNTQSINDIVHPAVVRDFLASGYDWMESAIYFEAGIAGRFEECGVKAECCDVVCVSAPLELRIQRVMNRDGISRPMAMAWIEKQMPQEEKEAASKYVIINDGLADLEEQLDAILR